MYLYRKTFKYDTFKKNSTNNKKHIYLKSYHNSTMEVIRPYRLWQSYDLKLRVNTYNTQK